MKTTFQPRAIWFFYTFILLWILIISGCKGGSGIPISPAVTTGSPIATNTHPLPTFTSTATTRPSPTPTSRPVPTNTPTPRPTVTLTPLEDWQIGYTAIVIDDPNDPDNHYHWEIQTIQLNNPKPVRLVENPQFDFSPKWSPDGKRVAYISVDSHPPSLIILDLKTGRSHEIEDVWTFEWSKDGLTIVYCEFGEIGAASNEFRFYLVRMDDLSHPRVLLVAAWNAKELHWSPSRDQILAVGQAEVGEDLASHLYLIDLDGRVQQIPLQKIPGHASWHPDGERIAYDCVTGDYRKPNEICMIDLRTQEEQELTHSGEIAAYPEWSPDGKRLAYVSSPVPGLPPNNIHLVYILDLETGKVTRPMQSWVHLAFPTWSPDGKYLAFIQKADIITETFMTESYALYIYELDTGRIVRLAAKGLFFEVPVWLPRR